MNRQGRQAFLQFALAVAASLAAASIWSAGLPLQPAEAGEIVLPFQADC